MPKSRKRKTQDFQKVKLKVGKKLPKGESVMNLSFKTKQIQLTQRIKDDAGQDSVTKKKLSVQDLLRQCDHHSSSARVNALSGLKEVWLNSSADLMVPTNVYGYGEILKKLSSLLIDNEAVVRHMAINLFKVILTKLSPKTSEDKSSSKLEGRLYSHIHAYLGCAMNHVHEDIKLDALVLFDTLLNLFPQLMVQQTGDLLKNLVGLIASPAYLGAKGDATTQRLSLNPDSKLPAMKFRAQVLIRMKRTFMEALEDQTKNGRLDEYSMKNNKDVVWSLHSDHAGSNTKQNTCLLKDSFDGKSRFSFLFQGGCHELEEYITKPSSLESFLNLSVPVLLQCWKEAHASVTNSDSDNLVSADSVEVMSLVACGIQLMFVLCVSQQRADSTDVSSDMYIVSPEVLVKNYQQDFEKLLVSDFPYSVQVQAPVAKKRKKNKAHQFVDNSASQSSLVALNLAICDIMSSFCADANFKPSSNYLQKVEAYLVRSLQKSPSMEQSKILARILKNVFSNKHIYTCFTKAYSAALKYYLSCGSKAPQKLLFYHLFSFMGKTWDGWKRDSSGAQPVFRYTYNSDISDILEHFFSNLPHLLLEVAGLENQGSWVYEILTLMAHGHVQNCSTTFRNSFMSSLNNILDPEKAVLVAADEITQRKLFSLIALGTPLSQDHLKQVLYLIRRPTDKPVLHHRKSCSLVSHAIYRIISCIRHNIPLANQTEFNNMSPDQHSQLSDYLKFMFSLQIGMTGEELDVLSPPESTDRDGDGWFTVDFTVQCDQWERHVEIASIVARELSSFYIPAMPSKRYHQTFTFFSNLEQLWKQTFINRKRVHILSAYSLIQFFHQAALPHIEEKPGSEFYELASRIVASVLTNVHCQGGLQNSGLSDQMVWQLKADVIQCLTADATLLNSVVKLLIHRSKDGSSSVEREASKAAECFLLLDENIKQKLTQKTDNRDVLVGPAMEMS
ncbi:hypothetical protein BsWGS_01231 [Bradybaena similaris]